MHTWSLADVIDNATIGFVRAASLGAVVVQGVLDALSPPHFQPVGDGHPIPGCPRPVECRTHGCAGDCSEAVEREAEEECSGPRLNDGLTPFDPQWKMTVANNKRCVDCMAPAHWNPELESWYHDDDGSDVCLVNQPDVRILVIDASPAVSAIPCPCGGGCPTECDRTQPGCVQTWGSDEEHAEALQRNKTSQAVSADSSRDSAAEGGSAPLSPSVACKDPSPNGDEGPAPVGHSPGRGAGHLTSRDLLAAAQYVRWWRESDNCDDSHANRVHLLDLADRLELAASTQK